MLCFLILKYSLVKNTFSGWKSYCFLSSNLKNDKFNEGKKIYSVILNLNFYLILKPGNFRVLNNKKFYKMIIQSCINTILYYHSKYKLVEKIITLSFDVDMGKPFGLENVCLLNKFFKEAII